MKIQLISDVHMEFWKGDRASIEDQLRALLQPADVLVVAGDLHIGHTNVYYALKTLSGLYKHVIYVPGNHEYYGGLELNAFNVPEFIQKLPLNVHFLNPGTIKIDGITFIGAALWTDFHHDIRAELNAALRINDFRRIKTTTEIMKQTNAYHKRAIKDAYEIINGQKVIVTHFLPAMECISAKYRDTDSISSDLNKYFANRMDDWIHELENVVWLFGHTHDYVDVTIGQTRCLAAPVGYPGERNSYTPITIML